MRKMSKTCNYIDTTELNHEELRKLIESDLKKDLHMHTQYSDGALTPKEVIDMRVAEGYELLAITDHDGIGGSVAGFPYAKEIGIPFIYGIEFDSEDPLGKDIHMLGYGFDPEDEAFLDKLIEVLTCRNERNERYRKALNRMGYDITPEEVKSVNKGRYVGKPTFATILVNKGVVSSIPEAFSTIFREPELKSIEKVTLPSEEVVQVIHDAGGLAVMAHPMEQRKRDESFADFEPRMYRIIDRMMEYGIDGIECFHPSASEMQSGLLVSYAEKHGMMITRGSDFHSLEGKRDFERYHRP